MYHVLKTDPEVFDAVLLGEKTFEIRKNDRDFKVHDYLELRRTEYTGEEMRNGKPLIYTEDAPGLKVQVSYILHGPVYGLEDGWVIMSIEKVEA